MSNRLYHAVFIVLASLFWASAVHSAIDLTFGVYASNKPTEMIAKFRPVLDVLESELSQTLGESVKIRLKIAHTYEEGRRQLVEGEVDFARFGPVSYILAKQQQPEISILAIESNQGSHIFNGIIAVPGDSKLTSITQLQGESFAFGNETSTIGRYLSQLYLMERGITAKDLSDYKYLDRHDKVGMMVAAGQFAAGALNEKTYNKLIKKGKQLKVLASFSSPTKPWLARAGLSAKIKDAIADTLLNIKEEKALSALSYQGFLTGDDSNYDMVRQSITRNAQFFQ